VNIGDDHNWVLFVAWITFAMLPEGPFPLLVLQGEQGSAKSTTARLARACIDPAGGELRAPPEDERDLAIAATNNYLLIYDNVSRVQDWFSDALCRLATGGGLGTRQLYTDKEEITFDFVRPVVLNGIEELATRSDLRDRCIVLDLPAIPDDRRRDEASIRRSFSEEHARILGAVYDTASMALRELHSCALKRAPRMADFARWGCAVERALKWQEGTFLRAYRRNQQDAVHLAVEHDVVANAIRDLADEMDFAGSMTELLCVLGSKVADDVRLSTAWPRTPRALSGRVRRAMTDLRQLDIEITFARGDTRRVTVSRPRRELLPPPGPRPM
jgi:hypothetical protein